MLSRPPTAHMDLRSATASPVCSGEGKRMANMSQAGVDAITM